MSNQLIENFQSILGEGISPELVAKWHSYMITSRKNGVALNLPDGFTIDKKFIELIRNNPQVDGLELIVIAYDNTGVATGGSTFAKDSISLVLAPTVNGQIDDKMLWDYTDPCKPPCTKLNRFKEQQK